MIVSIVQKRKLYLAAVDSMPREDGKKRIQCFPLGPITTVDGESWDFPSEDLQRVADDMNSRGVQIPVFVNHWTYEDPVGWVSEFEVTEQGLFGWVRWISDEIVQKIREEEIRYTSPGFYLDDAGRLMSMFELSLTNIPRMQGMQAVEASLAPRRGARMNRAAIVKALAAIQGETDPETIRAHVIASCKLPETTTYAEILAVLATDPEPTQAEQVTAAVTAALTAQEKRWEDRLTRERQATEAALTRKQANADFCRSVTAKVPPAAREPFAAFVASLSSEQFAALQAVMAKMPTFAPGRLGVAASKGAATRYSAEEILSSPELAAQMHADVTATMEANPGMKYHEAMALVNKGAN